MNTEHTVDLQKLSAQIANILPVIDPEPSREGLRETPMRHAKFYRDFLEKKPFNVTVFSSEGYQEMVTQTSIPFYSLCEHHMVPFFGTATVSYIPGDKIVGLSKLARIVTHFSHALQNQERITQQIGSFLEEQLQPKGVGVSLTARHLCMEMRGVEKIGTNTTTTFVTGAYKTNPSTRSEFLAIIK